MDSRRGVVATISAVVIFGTLVSANLLTLAGAQYEATSSWTVYEETATISDATLEFGLLSMDALSGLQRFAAAGPHPCSSPGAGYDQLSSSMDYFDPTGIASIHATVSSTLQSAGSGSDNISMLGPFSGAPDGELNLRESLSVDGGTLDGIVLFRKAEIHLVHLPVDVRGTTGLCARIGAALSGALSSLRNGGGRCDSTALGTTAERIRASFSGGLERNFELSVSALATQVGSCASLSYEVSVTQVGVEGVNGSFNWTVSQRGLFVA